MLYNTCYITYPELLCNIQVWLYNIQDGYITHPNLPDGNSESPSLSLPPAGCCYYAIMPVMRSGLTRSQ